MTADRRTTLVLVLLFGAGAPAAAATEPRTGGGSADPSRPVARFAIVVGNNHAASAETEDLHYADDDAVAIHQLFVEAGVTSLLFTRADADTRRLYPDANPAGAPRGDLIDAAMRDVFARMRVAADHGLRPELLFFYSGHGDVAGGEGYVLLEDRRLTSAEFYAWLAESPATRNHVFIDACRSFFLLFPKRAGGRRVPRSAALLSPIARPELANVGYVLSTASDRESHEWDAVKGGILSHELRSALRGGADADLDGRVTYRELGAFLHTANARIVNPTFRPDFLIRPPVGQFDGDVLRWPTQEPAVTAQVGEVGHVFIEDTRGVRLLDVHPAASQELHLHLPPQRPLFVCEQKGRRELELAGTEPIAGASLQRPEPGGATRPKGGSREKLALSELFDTPFGRADVAAFEDLASRDEIAARVAHDRWQRHERLTLAAGAVAVGAAAAGVTLSVLAVRKYLAGTDASQVERDGLNHDVRRLNLASIACYAGAAIAGAGWGWMRWHEDAEPSSLGEAVARAASGNGGGAMSASVTASAVTLTFTRPF